MYANTTMHIQKYISISIALLRTRRSPSGDEDKDSTRHFLDVVLKIPLESSTINYVTDLLRSHLDHDELLMLNLMNLRYLSIYGVPVARYERRFAQLA